MRIIETKNELKDFLNETLDICIVSDVMREKIKIMNNKVENGATIIAMQKEDGNYKIDIIE